MHVQASVFYVRCPLVLIYETLRYVIKRYLLRDTLTSATAHVYDLLSDLVSASLTFSLATIVTSVIFSFVFKRVAYISL